MSLGFALGWSLGTSLGALAVETVPVVATPSAPTNARSSALGLADLALVWGDAGADIALVDSDLASDPGLTTAALLSLFLDRRAEPDDQPPSGDVRDRRGWWADQFADIEGDLIGSRLWLLDRAKRLPDVALRAEEYVREALAWMVEDRVVSSLDVDVETTNRALLIAVTLNRTGRDPIALRFAHTWT